MTTSASANPASPRVESSGTGGFGAGWDFYHGATGKGYVGVPDSGAAFAPGELLLFGGPGTKVSLWPGGVRALTADPDGNVEVRGNIRMGPNAEFRATSSEENLRIVRGTVRQDGAILRHRRALRRRNFGHQRSDWKIPEQLLNPSTRHEP